MVVVHIADSLSHTALGLSLSLSLSGIPFLIFDKGLHPLDWEHIQKVRDNTIFSPFNFGAETTGYIQFMIEYYDCLPLRCWSLSIS